MRWKYIIFDFDGTICDSRTLIVKIVNELSITYAFRSITLQELDYLRELSFQEAVEWFQIKKWLLPLIIFQAKKKLYQHIHQLQPYPQILELLQTLKNHRLKLYIGSSNSQKNIRKFLELHQISLFDQVYVTSNNKKKLMTSFLKEKNIHPQDVVYIGDEIRDMQAANDTTITGIGVTWGANSAKALSQYTQYIAESIDQLEALLLKH